MTIAALRTLLGALGEGKTDLQVKLLHDELVAVANTMFDHLKSKLTDVGEVVTLDDDELPGFSSRSEEQLKHDRVEHIRWTAYLHENTDDKDAL